jgi:Domain of unknown function (DUF1707)
MDDHIRVSDADRERVTTRLQENFAEGRLNQDELDERISAALNAKTFGDLRPLTADLPGPVPAPPRPATPPRPTGPPPWVAYRRGPRLMPLLMLVALAALLVPAGGGWLVLGLFKVVLVVWVVSCLAGAFALAGYRRRMRRHWRSGYHRHGPGNQI